MQYGGFTHKTTCVKFYTHNYTKCKILLSVSENLRVFSRVFFYTRVSRVYFSRNLRVKWQIYTQETHV